MKKIKEIFAGLRTKSENNKQQGCCGGAEHQHHQDNGTNTNTNYQCPMKCEGDKTYDAPGTCPVCNMHLAPVGEKHVHH